MLPCDGPAICPPEGAPPPTLLEKFLRFAAVGTMLMTVPQVWSIWTTSVPEETTSQNEGPLAPEWRDHALHGKFAGHGECHAGGACRILQNVSA